MGDFQIGVCNPWVTTEDFLNCCDAVDDSTPPEMIENAIKIASDTLYILSGSQFKGICQRETTLVKQTCVDNSLRKKWFRPNEIDIGYWPVTEIISVTFNEVEQDLDNFRINDYRYLERLDEKKWPTQYGEDYQDVVVTFNYGIKPPPLGVEAAKAIAAEVMKACLNKECSLPDRATHISRRGVSITISDYEALAQDFIGIFLVDLFLQAVNPTKARIQSFVTRPGHAAKTRRLGT